MMNQPGFTVVTVLILAVGIGVTTAMWSTVKAALLSRLPFEEPDRLIMGRATFDGNVNPWVSGYDYYDYKEQSRSFESLSALFGFGGRVTILGGTEPERIASGYVTWDLFHTLRVKPVAGRPFAAEEGAAGRSNVVMISHGYWQRRFGGSSDVVGRTLIVNGSPFTIIGVMPAGFYFLDNLDIWRLTYHNGPGAEARRWHNLLLVGRLKPGVTIQQAQSEMDLISRRLEEQHPDTNQGKALLVTGLHDTMVENVRTSLLMLMAAVSLVLLLACGNVAGLLLAKGQSRLRELAIRSAMGASRRRLVCQLLTESTLMAVVAGIVGVGFAVVFQGMLIRLLPMGRIGITRPDIDAPVLLFTLGISIASGLLFGAAPALQGTIVEPSQELRAGTRSTTARGACVVRHGLVALQVAISIVLLIGAGLLIRSLSRQMNVDLGFNPARVLTAGVLLPDNDYPEPERLVGFFTSLIEEIEALPGVVSVGLIDRIPIRHPSGNIYVYPAGQPPGEVQGARMSRSADFRRVLPGYFKTMGIPLLAGRDIAETDVQGSTRVMIISESMAKLYFPNQDPLGKRLIVDMMGEMVAHEVVGVVANARLSRITSQPFHAMYMPYKQVPRSSMWVAVRALGDPTGLIRPIRKILQAKDRNVPLAEPATMQSILDDALADFRIITSSLGVFTSIALLLALVGLYGALAFHVSQRSHEIGVRMAMGASRRQVANMILLRGMGMVAAGLVLGLVGAYWATRLLQQLLFGVNPADPASFIAATVSFGMVAVIACLLPAWHATRVNPVSIMQAE